MPSAAERKLMPMGERKLMPMGNGGLVVTIPKVPKPLRKVETNFKNLSPGLIWYLSPVVWVAVPVPALPLPLLK